MAMTVLSGTISTGDIAGTVSTSTASTSGTATAMDDYKIILNASGWYDKGVLSDASMAKIQAAIQAQYPEEETTAEATTETTTEEMTTE